MLVLRGMMTVEYQGLKTGHLFKKIISIYCDKRTHIAKQCGIVLDVVSFDRVFGPTSILCKINIRNNINTTKLGKSAP
jgi:hypothetical protein